MTEQQVKEEQKVTVIVDGEEIDVNQLAVENDPVIGIKRSTLVKIGLAVGGVALGGFILSKLMDDEEDEEVIIVEKAEEV